MRPKAVTDLKNALYYPPDRTPLVAAFGYSNQSKRFREITASKFQRQHAAQFNFCRYEGLFPATKTESHHRFSNGILRNFSTVTFDNNFGGLLLKIKQEEKGVQ